MFYALFALTEGQKEAQFNSSVGDHHVTTAEYSTQTIHIS